VLLPNRWQPYAPPARVPPIETEPSRLVRSGAKADCANLPVGWNDLHYSLPAPATDPQPAAETHPQAVDPLYLFACHVEWQLREEPTAAWELIDATRSSHADTRSHARSFLASTYSIAADRAGERSGKAARSKRYASVEEDMKVPYGLEIIESCVGCTGRKPGFFCDFSEPVTKALDQASHRSTLPAGAILFVEGQLPRGLFVLCSGKVKLSTTSRDGKVLILKSAEAGEALGLSASISGEIYEMTAETATPCQVNFIDRKALLHLLHSHSEVGLHAAQSLSRDFQSAYRDIHDLVLARSSAGKLARLLLSCSSRQIEQADELRLRSAMTHEEMAQRIGSSRETVTRLISDLKRKQLIRLDGATLVIRDRTALEALAV
jgi:CRP/FNR family transcriptional regulator, cyclic AMP receptor protein